MAERFHGMEEVRGSIPLRSTRDLFAGSSEPFSSSGDLHSSELFCLLVRARNVAAEREMKVRYLPGPMAAPAESGALLLRRSGS